MRVLLPLRLPVAKTHTVYRTFGDLHDMLRHHHEAIARGEICTHRVLFVPIETAQP
jgi:hypothetical protein